MSKSAIFLPFWFYYSVCLQNNNNNNNNNKITLYSAVSIAMPKVLKIQNKKIKYPKNGLFSLLFQFGQIFFAQNKSKTVLKYIKIH